MLSQPREIKTMKNISKTLLAVFAGVISCALFSQNASACRIVGGMNTGMNTPAANIQGNINFAGAVQFDTHSLLTATRINTWFDAHGNAGFSSVTSGGTGDFASIPAGTQATMAQPWIFNPSTATPGLWSVGGFTFDLLSSTIVAQTTTLLAISGTGTVSGNGFAPTSMDWMFTAQNAGGHNMTTFSFSANGVSGAVPDGGTTVMLLGGALGALGMARRFLMS